MNHQAALASGRKLRIILLEDEPLLRQLFEEVICGWCKNVDLLAFENGNDVYLELSSSQPDLLITDALHPGMDGGGIICKLAEKPMTCPVLWTSGGSDYAFACLFDRLKIEVLPKPFGKEQLVEKLNLLLGSKRPTAMNVAPLVEDRHDVGGRQTCPARK